MSKYYFGLIAIIIAFLIISCEEDSPTNSVNETQTISGTILNPDDSPLANSYIEAYTVSEKTEKSDKNSLQSENVIASDTTDANGNFTLEGLPSDLSGIMLKVDNSDFKIHELDKSEKEEEKFKIKLERKEECTIELSFDIKDSKGASIQDAKIQLKREGKEVRNKKTDENGLATIFEVCPGDYDLRIFKEGYKTIEEDLNEILENKSFELTMQQNESESDSCCGGVINFLFKDEEGNPISGVKVLLKRDGKAIEDPRTNDDGKAIIDGLCEGDYRVIVTKEGYSALEYYIELGCDEELESSKTMEKKLEEEPCCTSVAQFKVTDKEGNAIPNATIKIWQKGKVVREAKTDADGWVKLEEFCEGGYGVDIMHEEYKNIEFEFEIGCGVEKTIEKTLESDDECCDNVARIVIKDKEGNPVKDAIVILKKDGKAVADPRTNGDGVVEIENLCEGNYVLVVEREGYERAEWEIEIECDEENNFTKEITKKEEEEPCCTSVAQFKLTDKDGNPIPNATIKIWQKGKVVREAKTDADGWVKLEEFCEGGYGVDIMHEEYKNIEFEFEIGCGVEKTIEKTLESDDECCDNVARIVIKDKEGNPVKDAIVILKKDGKAVADPRTNGDGVVEIENLCEGYYVLVVEREGYERAEWEIEIECDEENNFTKEITKKEEEEPCCTSVAQFKVTDKDDNPIQNATIKIWQKGKVVREAKTDADGWVKLEEFCEGEYGVDIMHEEYKNIEFEFEIGCGVEKTIEKTLESDEDCCEAIIKVIVRDKETEEVLENATVIYKLDGKIIADGKSNGDGVFIEDGLCLGKYTIIVEKDGYESNSFEWNIEKCDDFQETLKLKKK